ncbi:MAG: hypothetical protein QF415_09900 [Candidatus Undinarchaeales archaeon]|jgi:hypothetical protein|nr:hypothetical protein [Candidatus Undinarchaeales archaeon]MDP7492866.1 hypothetical protein [Candidatus Undinarchaeales archaeon]
MIDSIVGTAIEELPEGCIVLLETGEGTEPEVGMEAMRQLLDQGYSGMVLSAGQPLDKLIERCKNEDLDCERLLILDCVDGDAKCPTPELTDNVVRIDDITDLTFIVVSIISSIKKLPAKKFLLIDDIPAMLEKNHPLFFARFMHIVLTNIRHFHMSGVLVSKKDGINKMVRAEIAQLCDRVIEI